VSARTGFAGALRRNRGAALAWLALFASIAGTSYAATALPRGSVGAAQIRTRAVTATKLASRSVTAASVVPGTLTLGDLAAGQSLVATPGAAGGVGVAGVRGLDGPVGLAGSAGAIGARGPAGVRGAAGPAGAVGSNGPTGDAGTAGVQTVVQVFQGDTVSAGHSVTLDVLCPTGMQVISGGWGDNGHLRVQASSPIPPMFGLPSGWEVSLFDPGPNGSLMNVHALCAKLD
jgi:Collagen triple helix repeat (20 copies)